MMTDNMLFSKFQSQKHAHRCSQHCLANLKLRLMLQNITPQPLSPPERRKPPTVSPSPKTCSNAAPAKSLHSPIKASFQEQYSHHVRVLIMCLGYFAFGVSPLARKRLAQRPIDLL